MKKILLFSIIMLPSVVMAQFWDGSYQGHPAVQPPQRQVYTQDAYGTYYPLDGYSAQGGTYYMGKTVYGNSIYTQSSAGYDPTNSPVYRKNPKKNVKYATIRAGVGGTFGWGKGAKDPVGAVLSAVFGKYLDNNWRIDAEIAYHTKGTLYSRRVGKQKLEIKYRQYDLGGSAY